MVRNCKLSQLCLKPHACKQDDFIYSVIKHLRWTVEAPCCSAWHRLHKARPQILTFTVVALMFLQANTASSVLRTSSMRSIQLGRTSSPPTTSCGPSSCRPLVVAWTRRPHTSWREVTLATGKIRSTEWSGGWTELMVSWFFCRVCSQLPKTLLVFFLDVVHDA